MSYIGNTNTTQGFIPAIDYFSGNGSTVAFTLSRPVASVAQVQANISNVPQNPSSAFSVSGNTITFTSAPPSGSNNIYVYYTSPITQVIAPSQGTVTSESFGTIVNFTTTGNTILGDASTDTLNVGNGGLVKDASGNVGIGTSSPSAKFEVRGGRSFFQANSEPYAVYVSYASGTNGYFIGGTSTSALAFSEAGGTERMRIDSSGNVGIGTTSPNGKLDVAVSGGINLALTKTGGAYLSFCEGTTTRAAINGLPSADGLAFATGSALTERMRIASTGQMSTTNGAGALALAYDCRAWVNFNGTGTVAIRASGNVTSITDNGTGDYTVNFTTAMSDANFSCSAIITRSGNGSAVDAAVIVSQATGNLRIQTWWANFAAGGQFDPATVAVAIFR
jgi:hypothetical protein